jgi:hypothetical protein
MLIMEICSSKQLAMQNLQIMKLLMTRSRCSFPFAFPDEKQLISNHPDYVLVFLTPANSQKQGDFLQWPPGQLRRATQQQHVHVIYTDLKISTNINVHVASTS